jgi:glutamate-1-semialdehyde 2,1-aminomutase
MGAISSGLYEQVGTFNGNPLCMAAAKAVLTEIMVPETYARLFEIEDRMRNGAQRIVDEFELPAYVVTIGAKGCITYSTERVTNYRQFLTIDERFAYAAWLMQLNRGVFLPPWTTGEQWLTSIQHTDEDIDLYLETLEAFGRAFRR